MKKMLSIRHISWDCSVRSVHTRPLQEVQLVSALSRKEREWTQIQMNLYLHTILEILLVPVITFFTQGKNVLVIGTTSELNFLDSVGIQDAFSVTYNVPTLKTEDAKKVLEQLKVFSEEDIDTAAEALNDKKCEGPLDRYLHPAARLMVRHRYTGHAFS